MTKDVLVRVTGRHLMEQDSGEIGVTAEGSYYEKSSGHFLAYDEIQEGGEKVHVVLKIGADRVDMMRSGAVKTHMEFLPGRTTKNCYYTPYGEMLLSVTTKELETDIREDRIEVRIRYLLEIDGGAGSSAEIRITAVPRK